MYQTQQATIASLGAKHELISSGTGESVQLRGRLCLCEPLARYTSWRVGGPAARLYQPADRDDLIVFLSRLDPEEPLLWLGLGSNLLVDDEGFAGTVVYTRGCLNQLKVGDDNRSVYAEAGVSCAKAARFAMDAGLVGIEFLVGIPGTIGGALAMNAGAWGGETWHRVVRVRTLDRRGRVRERTREEFDVGYRRVKGPGKEWFLDADFQLMYGDLREARARIRKLLAKRAATQPIGLPSCGSVFRNPPNEYAARLIEVAGLKGRRIGGAEVSQKHANFIINNGTASATDIANLIDLVRSEVERTSGIRLTPEVHRVGGAAQ